MKNQFILYFVALAVSLISCTKFEDLNTDPMKSDNMDPNLQLSYVQLATYGLVEPNNSIQSYASAFVQQFQGEYNKTHHGGKYRIVDQLISTIWNEWYNKPVKEIVDVIHRTNDVPEQANLNAIARIYRVYLLSVLTDLYGDIPYFEAGQGYISNNFTPSYDKQEDIYKDFFKELDSAVTTLQQGSGSLPVTGDVVFQGNAQSWIKLANSLHLRYAMRVIKADPQLSKTQATLALQADRGGLISQSSEEALIPYMEGIFDWDVNEIRRNSQAQLFIGREASPLPFLASTFWNYLQNKNDPRLFVIGRTYWGEGANFNGLEAFNRTDITQEVIERGKFQPVDPGYFWYDRWPSGYWSNTLNIWVDKWTRPQLNNIFLKSDIPGVIMTYAETEFLLAEAKVRWPELATNQTAEEHYEDAIRAAMQLFELKYNGPQIPNTQVDEFLAAVPFPNASEEQIKLINEQLWILHIMNPTEAYANWRRSGYPILKSATEYGALTIDSQTIPRRLPYPLFEKSYNPRSYQEALERLGGTDDWNARVWWDKN